MTFLGNHKREIRVEGDIAFIPLTKGYEAIIDVEDIPLIRDYNWSAFVARRTVYAMRCQKKDGKTKSIMLHRILVNCPVGLEVDHIDGNGLNNRVRGQSSNLRIATKSQNMCNIGPHKDNSLKLKGVSLHRQSGLYRAKIAVRKKIISLGYFPDPQAAHAAYCEASEKLHGEFGRFEWPK